jgi:hypothetical protein
MTSDTEMDALKSDEPLAREGKPSSRRDNSHLYALVSLGVVLYLPYFVPQHPVASASYLFGYNNRAGLILLLTFIAAAAIRRKGYGLKLLPAGESKKISRRTLGICLAIQLAACLMMILVMGKFGGFAESVYEIDRVWLLAQGRIAYAGFEWPFGVLFLYGPLWLSHLLHCGIAGGYYVFWTLASLAGVALLFATINCLDYPSPRKTSIFLLLFVAVLPSTIGMGTHYTWLRFITPFYCILVVNRVSLRKLQPNACRVAAALAVCFTALLLLISPEMALAHCFASCVLLFPRKSAISPAAVPASTYAAMLAGFSALFGVGLKLHVLDTLLASGGGADSFPIPLSAPVIFFFGVVFVCACVVVRRWYIPSLKDNSIALIVLSIPLMAAALGRCDPTHILLNGIGLYLAVFLYVSTSPRMWRLFRNSFVVIVIVLPGYVALRYVIPLVGKTAMRAAAEDCQPEATGMRAAIARWGVRHLPAAGSEGRLAELARLRAHAAPDEIDFGSVYPGFDLTRSHGIFEAPFGYKPNGLGSYHSSKVDYGFYEGLENANTPRAVQRKIDELAQYPERDLLLPQSSGDLCGFDVNLERQLITVLFFFPYTASVAHPISPHAPLCDYIASHYTLAEMATPENFGYELWTPRRASPAQPVIPGHESWLKDCHPAVARADGTPRDPGGDGWGGPGQQGLVERATDVCTEGGVAIFGLTGGAYRLEDFR